MTDRELPGWYYALIRFRAQMRRMTHERSLQKLHVLQRRLV